jgi:hypothetical protein
MAPRVWAGATRYPAALATPALVDLDETGHSGAENAQFRQGQLLQMLATQSPSGTAITIAPAQNAVQQFAASRESQVGARHAPTPAGLRNARRARGSPGLGPIQLKRPVLDQQPSNRVPPTFCDTARRTSWVRTLIGGVGGQRRCRRRLRFGAVRRRLGWCLGRVGGGTVAAAWRRFLFLRRRSAVGAVEPRPLEHHTNCRKHLAKPATALGALGERSVGDALDSL